MNSSQYRCKNCGTLLQCYLQQDRPHLPPAFLLAWAGARRRVVRRTAATRTVRALTIVLASSSVTTRALNQHLRSLREVLQSQRRPLPQCLTCESASRHEIVKLRVIFGTIVLGSSIVTSLAPHQAPCQPGNYLIMSPCHHIINPLQHGEIVRKHFSNYKNTQNCYIPCCKMFLSTPPTPTHQHHSQLVVVTLELRKTIYPCNWCHFCKSRICYYRLAIRKHSCKRGCPVHKLYLEFQSRN